MELRRIIDQEERKVFLFFEALQEPATKEQKIAFLSHVMEYINTEYPGIPANYFEENNVDTLSIVVIIGINTII